MKRFSKILAVLLSVCVIAGLIAVFASAEDATDYREVSENFDTLTSAGTDAPLDTWTTDSTGAVVEDLGAAQVTVGSEESPVNKYVKLYATAGTGESMPASGGDYRNGTNFVSYMINGAGAEQKIINHRYTVLQFLFTADGGKYVDGAYIQPRTTNGNDLGSVMVSWDGSKYVAKAGTNTTAGNSVPLNTDGDWNVVTYVLAMDGFAEGGGATVGANSKTNSYIYVNGQYCAKRWMSTPVDYGYFASLKIGRYYSTSVAAGDNIIVDGVNVRSYLNNLGANDETTYTTAAGVYGVPTFLSDSPMATTADAFKMQDVKYSYYSTTVDYPKLSENYVRSGVVAHIGDLGYFTVDAAFAAVKDGETIKLYDDREISSDDIAVTNFIVEAYNGAEITFATGYLTTEETIDGGVRYTVEKITPAYIGEKPYDTVAEALADLTENGTIKVFVDATITGVDLKNFTVEAYNGAVVDFGELVSHNIVQSEAEGVKTYVLTPRDFLEYTNNTTVTVTTAAKTWTLQSANTTCQIKNYKYAVVQYLLKGDDNGNYASGVTIKPSVSVSNSDFGTIQITETSTGVYSVSSKSGISGGTASIPLTNVAGDWNVITMVIKPTFKTTDVNGDGQYTVGDYASFDVYYYINGTYLGKRSAGTAVNLGHVQGIVVTGATATDSSVTLAGYNARYYLNGLDISTNSYTTPNTYGIDDFIGSYSSADVTALQDVKYNKYITTADYPETTVNGQPHIQTGAVAEVNGVGYFNLGTALGALENNGTIKIFANETIAGVSLKKFYVEAYNGAVPTIEGYEVTSEAIDGGTRYTATLTTPPSVDGVEQDSVASALAAIQNGSVVKFYSAATITGVTADNFTVEVYDGAKVVFAADVLRNHDVVKRIGQSAIYYTVTARPYIIEYVDNLDSFDVQTSNSWTATTVPVIKDGEVINNYQKLTTSATSATGTFRVLTSASSVPTIRDAKYTVIQFLLGAEGGEYIDGAFVRPFRENGNVFDTTIGGILIKKGTDGKFHAHFAKDYSGTEKAGDVILNGDGEWNVVTLVIEADYANNLTLGAATTTVQSHFYVNGVRVGGRNQGTAAAHSLLTAITFTTTAASEANANILIDGYVRRSYSSGEAGKLATYTLGNDVADINDYFKGRQSASTENFKKLEDIYYGKNSTTESYPAIYDANENICYKSGAVAEVNGIGYFDLDNAWNALTEGGTITFNADYTVPATELKNFTILHAEGVNVNIDALAESHKVTAIDGGWSFVPAVKYNVVYKYGEAEIDRKEISTEMAPTPSAVDWSAYIKGNASLATWMIKIGDAEAVVWNGAWDEATISEGMTVIVYPADDSIVTLTWNGIEGRADKYFKGSELINVEYPELSGEVIEVLNNNWYDIAYGWAELPEAINENIEVQQTLVPVANVKAKFSYTLGLRFYPTFYLPVATEDANVTVNGANYVGDFFSHYTYDGEMPDDLRDVIDTSNANVWGVVDLDLKTVGGVSYYVGQTDIRPEYLEWVTAFQVNFTVNYNGVDYELCAPLFSSFLSDYNEEEHHVLNYAEKVLESGKHDSGTKLVAEFLRLFMLANDGASTEKANALLALHADCACAPAALDDAVPTPEEAAGFTHENETMPADMKISFRTDANAGGFQLYLPTSFVSQYASVKVSTLPIGGIIDNAYVDENTPYQVFNKQDAGVDGLTDYTRFRAHHDQGQFKLFNFACVTSFKIVCTPSEGEAVTYEFTYSLAEYLYDLQNSDAVAANTISVQLGKAYMNFVVAAFNYKSGK